MPSRTVWPRISITSTIMLSPRTMRSPARRVILSMPSCDVGCGLGGGGWFEQRDAQFVSRGLVDHLMPPPRPDEDRGLQVGGEVFELLGRADRHVHGYRGDVVEPEAFGLLVVELHRERREELMGIGHGQGKLGVLER